jgi:hypothetical protein
MANRLVAARPTCCNIWRALPIAWRLRIIAGWRSTRGGSPSGGQLTPMATASGRCPSTRSSACGVFSCLGAPRASSVAAMMGGWRIGDGRPPLASVAVCSSGSARPRQGSSLPRRLSPGRHSPGDAGQPARVGLGSGWPAALPSRHHARGSRHRPATLPRRRPPAGAGPSDRVAAGKITRPPWAGRRAFAARSRWLRSPRNAPPIRRLPWARGLRRACRVPAPDAGTACPPPSRPLACLPSP